MKLKKCVEEVIKKAACPLITKWTDLLYDDGPAPLPSQRKTRKVAQHYLLGKLLGSKLDCHGLLKGFVSSHVNLIQPALLQARSSAAEMVEYPLEFHARAWRAQVEINGCHQCTKC